MFRPGSLLALAGLLMAASLDAQQIGTASGKGTIGRLKPSGDVEQVPFAPRHTFAYAESSQGQKSTWIVLTEKEPPVKAWMAAKDREEARRAWCGKEKTPFVAVKLDHDLNVDLYFLCPANGGVNTEMVSSWNGLQSVEMRWETRGDKRLKGSFRTGSGSCPDANGKPAYCTQTGDYTFDVALSR
jgi:hypothetical protein